MPTRVLSILAIFLASAFASVQAGQVYDYSDDGFGALAFDEDGGEFLSFGYDVGNGLSTAGTDSASTASSSSYGSYYNTNGGYWWFIGGNFWNWNGGIDNWFGSDPRPETSVSEPAGIAAISLVALGGLMAWRRRQRRAV